MRYPIMRPMLKAGDSRTKSASFWACPAARLDHVSNQLGADQTHISEDSETSCITLASMFCPIVTFLAPSVVCRVLKDLVYAYHPLFSAKAENATDRLGYHAFFVRAND